eukprot:CAMPEP_0194717874 /NCGR_PEP_ID=MMETSP0296-20130528/9485_1 /TAXON_ID=39354 /ORGANISM="Heterosigma akashiwo, Strain CCMP2393" /LENGTH=74 /DNA_ID=CAMNT_0039618931 /DNA_START=402 /DNA_END=626 /DNA_ORIENTATION=-
MVATKRGMAALSTVGLKQHAQDLVHLAGRDDMGSEEGNFVMKCWRAAVYDGVFLTGAQKNLESSNCLFFGDDIH